MMIIKKVLIIYVLLQRYWKFFGLFFFDFELSFSELNAIHCDAGLSYVDLFFFYEKVAYKKRNESNLVLSEFCKNEKNRGQREL